MKDFQLRNDTKLLFRNDPAADLAALTEGKKVLFVYGGGSVKTNGCYDDVKKAVESAGGTLYELANASRELEIIEKGIALAKEKSIELVIGAGGANIMDCAKLIAFGTYHADDLWAYIKSEKNPYGLKKLPLILMPTYPSSGSEYGLGAVSSDARRGDRGTAYGIAADTAILVPKYSMSLGAELTAYTGLVTLVQLSASTIGDQNPVSYDIGISVIRNVLAATKKLRENPQDEDARGVILYGASISTSGRLGLGKEENYAYDIYEVMSVPEDLYSASYRKSLTAMFPPFLKAMAKYHEADIRRYFKDAFGYEGSIEESAAKMTKLFEELGANMYFDGEISVEETKTVNMSTMFSVEEVTEMVKECLR